MQRGGMEGGGREDEDLGGGSKRARDEDQTTEQVDTQGGCSKKRRKRSRNWSVKETLQMLELRKEIVQDSSAKGSEAWEQIAQALARMNPEFEARSGKQVAQRWDTVVKLFVSVNEVCGETGKSFEEVIGERQKRGKTEPYPKEWHELIAQGNPGKRRPRGKTAGQPDGPPQGIIPQATPASLSPDATLAVMARVWESDKIAKGSTEMLDTINHSMSFPEERSKAVEQGDENIFLGPNGDLENDQERGVKNQQDETEAEAARTVQSMAETVQNILKADSRSETFCLEVDRNDLLTLSTILSAASLRPLSVQSISEEVGADVRIRPPLRIISTARCTRDLYNSTQPILPVIKPSTSSDTCIELSDIKPSSSGFSDITPWILEPSDNMMVFSPKSEGTNAALGQNVVSGSKRNRTFWEPEDGEGLVTTISTSGVKKRKCELKVEVARAAQSTADPMQSISKPVSISESFRPKVDQEALSMAIQMALYGISQKPQETLVRGISEEIGADVRIRPPLRIISTARCTRDLYNSTQPILPVISPSTSSDTCIGLSDIEPLSSGFSDVMPLRQEPSDSMMVLSPNSEGTNAVLGRNVVWGSNLEPEDDEGLVTTISMSGVKKPEDEMKAEVARATQCIADPIQSISMPGSTLESFCPEVDQEEWSMAIQRLSEISQKFQAISVEGIREEVDAYVWISSSQQQPVSAARSGDNHTESSSGRSVSSTSSVYLPEICTRMIASLNTKKLENSWSRGNYNGGSTASPESSTASPESSTASPESSTASPESSTASPESSTTSPESSSSTFAGLQDIMSLSSESDGESLCRANWSNPFPTTSVHATPQFDSKKALRWLKSIYSLSIPPTVKLSNLTSLDFSWSTTAASLWLESDSTFKAFTNLLKLDLSFCSSITTLPDSIRHLSRLEQLHLNGCINLQKLPISIGRLTALHELSLYGCGRLDALSKSIAAFFWLPILSMVECSHLLDPIKMVVAM